MTTADGAVLEAILLVSIAPQAPATSDFTPTVDVDTRNAVLGKLASRLEADYAVPQTATKLAQAMRDKQKLDAYRNITCAPELARRLTDTVRDSFDALDPGISQGVRKTAACFSHRPGGITAGCLVHNRWRHRLTSGQWCATAGEASVHATPGAVLRS
jgi:hypothetical protein